MTRQLLASVVLAAVAMGSALAADAPPSRRLPQPRAAAYVPFFTWNGFYVGINAGYGFGRSTWTDTITQVSTGSFAVKGALIGGTVGYNVQFGSFLFGFEGDLAWSNIKGSTTTNCISTCETSNTWLGTARGRVGYALDRFLPYFTAGAAFGDVKATATGFGSANQTKVGWTAGAGLEYAFVDNWTAKLEYLYVDLGTATCTSLCAVVDPINVTFKTNIVRGGVNYKF
jgi:outer membrane immunogenic protein